METDVSGDGGGNGHGNVRSWFAVFLIPISTRYLTRKVRRTKDGRFDPMTGFSSAGTLPRGQLSCLVPAESESILRVFMHSQASREEVKRG